MGYHPRIETTNVANLTTVRSRNSELWLVNNRELEGAILGYVAKYSTRHKVDLYAFGIQGNHLHGTAQFPEANRAHFMRDLNSNVARAVARHVPTYPGGRLWARRYSAEYLLEDADTEAKFFYTVLQPVQDGLVDRLSEYKGYNCFRAAACGTVEKYRVINWTKYNDARRWRSDVRPKDFEEEFELRYARLPGREAMSPKEYRAFMYRKLEEYRQAVLARRNRPAAGAAAIARIKPGALPRNTKTSTSISHRPRVFSNNPRARREGKTWYFNIYASYHKASAQYREGDLTVAFPPGTYRPPSFTVCCQAPSFAASG